MIVNCTFLVKPSLYLKAAPEVADDGGSETTPHQTAAVGQRHRTANSEPITSLGSLGSTSISNPCSSTESASEIIHSDGRSRSLDRRNFSKKKSKNRKKRYNTYTIHRHAYSKLAFFFVHYWKGL